MGRRGAEEHRETAQYENWRAKARHGKTGEKTEKDMARKRAI